MVFPGFPSTLLPRLVLAGLAGLAVSASLAVATVWLSCAEGVPIAPASPVASVREVEEAAGPGFEVRRPVTVREPDPTPPNGPAAGTEWEGGEAEPGLELPHRSDRLPKGPGEGDDVAARPSYEQGASRSEQVERHVRIGMSRAEILRHFGQPEQVRPRNGREGSDGSEAYRYGRIWMVLENGLVRCVRTRLQYVARYDSDCHCAGFSDSFLLR